MIPILTQILSGNLELRKPLSAFNGTDVKWYPIILKILYLLQEENILQFKYPNGSLQVRNTKTEAGETAQCGNVSHTSLAS